MSYDRDYYQAHKAERREQAREGQALRRSAAAIWKLERGCIDCGYDLHPEALEFDHPIGTKRGGHDRGSVGSMISRRVALEEFVEEMELCEVVCANCHRVRTYVGQAAG